MVDQEESLPERIRRTHNSLSASQQKIARFCLTQASQAGELTALRIASELGVSESTVVRFAIKMGYRGFPDMQAAIRTSSRRLVAASESAGTSDVSASVERSLRGDLECLKDSIEHLDARTLAAAVESLDNARTIHVCGFRTSFSLAYLADFHIKQVHKSVNLIDAIGGTHSDDLDLVEPDDAVLCFTFPVYDARTIAVIERANEVGAAAVVITDSALAPIPISSLIHSLLVRHDSPTVFNSNVAANAMLNAIVTMLVERRSARDPKFESRLTNRFHHRREVLT